jgi:hypothetical protein
MNAMLMEEGTGRMRGRWVGLGALSRSAAWSWAST